ncbi:MAG: ATP-binding protein [Chloroflexota bacterium]
MRLFPKLLLSYFAVVIVGVVVVSLVANNAAAREVRGFMFRGGMTTETAMAQELAGYYRGHGSWEGVRALLESNHGMGGMMDQRLIVADAQGQVVGDTLDALTGDTLSESDRANGTALEMDGARIGTLIVEGNAMGGMMGGGGVGPGAGSGDLESQLLARVNSAIWLAALAAGGAALLVGGVFAFGLVRPIRQLKAATRSIAHGDLSQRVPVASKDELGELAASFNSMAADLQKAERVRRDMTADIAHELRNPIAVLQANIEAVLDGVLPPTGENLQPLLDQTRLLTRLVDDLRTLALADSGQLSLHLAPTDPVALLRSVVARFAPQAEAKKISLRSELPDGLPMLTIDPERIAQVLGNLISNALRHTPEGGRVVVRLLGGSNHLTTQQPNPLVFQVSDSGSGIPADSLPHVFERFHRADKSRARAEGGTGLGLAIAKQLVELHGGKIWVTSEEGRGTEVSFTL